MGFFDYERTQGSSQMKFLARIILSIIVIAVFVVLYLLAVVRYVWELFTEGS